MTILKMSSTYAPTLKEDPAGATGSCSAPA